MKIDSKLLISACVLALLVSLIITDSAFILFGFISAVAGLGYLAKIESKKTQDEITRDLVTLQTQISDLKNKMDAILLSRGGR